MSQRERLSNYQVATLKHLAICCGNGGQVKLAAELANEKLDQVCTQLVAEGWGWALRSNQVGNKRHNYNLYRKAGEPWKATPEQSARLAELARVFQADDLFEDRELGELDDVQQAAFFAHHELEQAIFAQSYAPAMRAKKGCFVDVDDNGLLDIGFGYEKVAASASSSSSSSAAKTPDKKGAAAAAAPAAKAAAAPEPTELSQALRDRLEQQLLQATVDALFQVKTSTPLFEVLLQTIAKQVTPERRWHMPDTTRLALPKIREAIGGALFNAASRKIFDADDYFSNAPSKFAIEAIAEAVNPDQARKVAEGKRADVKTFALLHVVKTGWLPKELRGPHYDGPGSANYKPPKAAAKAAGKAKASAKKKAAKKK